MADECYRHPRLAAVYDPLDPDRGDLDAYLVRDAPDRPGREFVFVARRP